MIPGLPLDHSEVHDVAFPFLREKLHGCDVYFSFECFGRRSFEGYTVVPIVHFASVEQ